jgi:N-acetyl sugar amidotransferase
MTEYRQCAIGVLDNRDDPNMLFDEQGRSNYYHSYIEAEAANVVAGEDGEQLLQALARQIRDDGRGKPYDCLMGVSGGVDSTYVAYQAKRLGLRPLAVHLDNGWNSELAVMNVQNVLDKLDIDLFTEVLDWAMFRDLQRSYLKASVVDIEVISDHAIFATLYRLAGKMGIRHILSGTNIVTEFVMPPHWIYNKTDHVNIKAIHKVFGTVPLSGYPFMNLKVKKWYQLIKKVRSHSILDWVPYNKANVKSFIQDQLGWRDYGGKHYESVFTRFYQGYILPRKFGIDKRKSHLTNLIYSGQITKVEALAELQVPPLPPELEREDYQFVTKKLGFTNSEFEAIMMSEQKPHTDYETEKSIYETYPLLRPLKRPVDGIISLIT